ncbi:MAG: ABC transporter ATP-binding protein [Deltaproteobacteria bacterium]|nr:MAG: ABC transporter ATP-binding protein [Deltaproteobacteria bacterium]
MKISINGLSKQYSHGIQALKGIDLEIESGVFGLLGPNGAGKTTLMRILATLLEPSQGSVKFGDLDLRKDRAAIRAMLGYLPQNFSTFSRLTTWEFLDYSAHLAGIRQSRARKKAVEQMLETVGLYEARDREANKLSGGMKRRLGIAQALIGNPRVLIVDEPTVGLDPEERLRFRNLLAEMAHNEIIIILSTHIVGDISGSCSRMAMLHRGELVYDDSPEKLIDQARGHIWRIQARDFELDLIKQHYPVVSTVPSENGWELQVVADKLDGFKAEPMEPNLEHAYVYFLENVLGESWNETLP